RAIPSRRPSIFLLVSLATMAMTLTFTSPFFAPSQAGDGEARSSQAIREDDKVMAEGVKATTDVCCCRLIVSRLSVAVSVFSGPHSSERDLDHGHAVAGRVDERRGGLGPLWLNVLDLHVAAAGPRPGALLRRFADDEAFGVGPVHRDDGQLVRGGDRQR